MLAMMIEILKYKWGRDMIAASIELHENGKVDCVQHLDISCTAVGASLSQLFFRTRIPTDLNIPPPRACGLHRFSHHIPDYVSLMGDSCLNSRIFRNSP